MIGARPSIGSSSSSSAGLTISARAIASICCSPPESWLPKFALPLLEAREDLVDARDVPGPGPRDRGQVLLDGERREHVALLRHPAESRCGCAGASAARRGRSPRQRKSPPRSRVRPISVTSSVVLPMPLRPSSARLSPSSSSTATRPRARRRRRSRRSAPSTAQELSHAAPRPDRPRARADPRAISAGRALGQHLAADQHRDALGEAEHELHVVLDEQDRDVAAAAPAMTPNSSALSAGGNAGRRLVEQQDPRPRGERQRDLDQPLLAVGQVARQRIGVGVEPQRAQQRARLVDLLAAGSRPCDASRGAGPCARRSRARPTRAPSSPGNSVLIWNVRVTPRLTRSMLRQAR